MQERRPQIAMMMAMDSNRLIGRDGQLPWHIPGELAYFKAVTLGKPVIMGRKTFEAIGKPLPGRTNIVVTRNPHWQAEGVSVTGSLEEALQLAHVSLSRSPLPDDKEPEFVIIGGAALCRDAMPLTDRLYLTVVDHAFEGDTWLDSFDWAEWKAVSEDVRDPATTGGLPVTYWILERP